MASLTLTEAEHILAAAKAKVLEMGAKMSVSVVDPRGDLIAMFRTDGASWRTPLRSIDGSIGSGIGATGASAAPPGTPGYRKPSSWASEASRACGPGSCGGDFPIHLTFRSALSR